MQLKSKSFRNNSFFAINEYFKRNDELLELTFDPNAGVSLESKNCERIMALDEFLKILIIGQPTITEKSIFLCKFQRGLDSSTFIDQTSCVIRLILQHYTNSFTTRSKAKLKPFPFMLTYKQLSKKPKAFLSYTGITRY